MAVKTLIRKPLSVRATAQERRLLIAAAKRERRSLNSFVLEAALRAAKGGTSSLPVERTPETIEAAIRRAQELMRRHLKPGQSLSEELIAERRAEAALE